MRIVFTIHQDDYDLMTTPRFYRHYKNKPYTYLGTARHSETLEELVLYETRYENALGRVWVRPKEMFFEKIEKDGKVVFRFEPIAFNYKETTQISAKNISDIEMITAKCFKQFDLQKLNLKLNSKLSENPKAFLVIAYDNSLPIGFKLGFSLDDNIFNSWLCCVLPEYRGLGVACEFMIKQHHWVKNNNFKKIQTKTRNYFHDMIRLNLKHGFEIISTEVESNNEITVLFQKIV